MANISIFGRQIPQYGRGLGLTGNENFNKRRRYVAGFIKKGDSVLELTCGSAILADFLPRDVHYRSLDIRKDPIGLVSKKPSSIHLGEILEVNGISQADIVVVGGVLHHLKPADRRRFVKDCFASAKKALILCESGKKKETNGFWDSIKRRTWEGHKNGVSDSFRDDYLITNEQFLDGIENGFGVISPAAKRDTRVFGDDMAAVFFADRDVYQRIRRQKSVSAIVPVFNEERTVANVIKTLLRSDSVNEVICINDGSTDKSPDIVRKFGNKIQLIDLKKNRGKGFALAKGIKKAKGEVVIFIDADLTTLADKHIETLLEPILSGKTRAVLGYATTGGHIHSVFSNLTGERAYYKKDLLPYLGRMSETRFGVEIFLNDLFDEKKTKKIPLKQLVGLNKYEKRNPANAIREYLGEAVEIAQEIGKREGLLPKDSQIISQIAGITNPNELSAKIKEITNKNVRQFFEKYIVSYIKATQRWWKQS